MRRPFIKRLRSNLITVEEFVKRRFGLKRGKPKTSISGAGVYRTQSYNPPPTGGADGDDEKVAIDSSATPDYLGATNADGVLRTDPTLIYADHGDYVTLAVDASELDHGALQGLGDDDHPQYALLNGRSGGQTLTGGTGAGDELVLKSTSNANKGSIHLGETGMVELLLNAATKDVSINAADGSLANFFATQSGSGNILNANGLDIDTTIEGDTDPNLLFCDAGNDRVGIGTASPSEKLHCSAKVRADTCFNVNGSDGITQMISFRDAAGTNHILTFTGGILTGYSTL